MDGYPEYRISVTEPVNWALSWTKQVLFAPFDLGKWFVIGFCAWLATLGEGGCNFGGSWNRDGGSRESIEQGIREGGEYVAQNAVRLIPVVIIVLVIALGAAVLLAWLRSRGKFMFLYCVARVPGDAVGQRRPLCAVYPVLHPDHAGDRLGAVRPYPGDLLLLLRRLRDGASVPRNGAAAADPGV